jgi:hypothetical protein
MEQITCGACGAPVSLDSQKCPFCDSQFVPNPPPNTIVLEPVEPTVVPPIKRYDLLQKGAFFIDDIREGEIGYCVPWAVATDGRGINKYYSYYHKPSGTVSLKIKMHHGTILIIKGSVWARETSDWKQHLLLPTKFVERF